MTASSPACQPVTPSPTASTTPAPSEPGMHGGCTSRWTTYRSRWLSAAAFRRMTICAGPGARSGRSASASAVRGLRAASCRARIQESFRRVKRRKAKGESKSRRHSERGAGTTGCSITAPTGAFQRWRGVMLYCSKGSQARSSSMTDLMGRTIGQYQLLDEIGRGGMATVYRAHQLNIDREVALKILPAQLAHDPTFLARFEREVQIAARVQHPRILPVFDVGEFEGQPYIVMAYMPGGTLEGWIQQSEGRGLPVDEALRIVSQVAEGLDALHAQGIVHRDLKPSNILLDEHGDCFLSDFGAAQLLETTAHLTGTGLVGTPGYMAPEAFQHGQTSAASDLYALGISAWEMLAGRHPFEAETPAQWMRAHIEKAVPDIRRFRPDLPEGLNVVLQAATAKDPAQRYHSAGQMAYALRDAIRVRPRPRKRAARRPAWLWAAGGAGLVGVLALGLVGGLLLLNGAQAEGQPVPTVTEPPAVAPATVGPTATIPSAPTGTPPPAADLPATPIGGGTGVIGINARGANCLNCQWSTAALLDADCAIRGAAGCDATPHVLAEIGYTDYATYFGETGIFPVYVSFGSWSPDGRYIAVETFRKVSQTNSPDSAVTYHTRSVATVISNGIAFITGADSAAWAADGYRLAFLGGTHGISVMDLTCPLSGGSDCVVTEQPVFSPETPLIHQGNNVIQWSPDGRRLLFWQWHMAYAQLNSAAYVLDAGGWYIQESFDYPVAGLDWLPDGQHILVLDYPEGTTGQPALRIANVETHEATTIALLNTATGTTGVLPESLQVAPDGRRAVVVFRPDDLPYGNPEPDYEIFLIDLSCLDAGVAACADSAALARLTDNDHDEGIPAWSPDGNWLAFPRLEGNRNGQGASGLLDVPADIYVFRMDGPLVDGAALEPIRLTTLGPVLWDQARLQWRPAPGP